MANFQELFVDTDSSQIKLTIWEAIQTRFPDWRPNPGNLDTWMTEAFARLISVVLALASEMGAAAFKKFGETIANVPPILAAPATVSSTWTMIDADGHEIPAGALVRIAAAGDEPPQQFAVVNAVSVPAESTVTAEGEVLLQAVIPGVAGNDLSADPELESGLTFVDSITSDGVTSGGVDDEDPDAYLDRLTEEMQLLSLSLIVPRDFEVDARAVAGVARALCIPGYNPEDKTEDNPLCLCVFPVDSAGEALSEPTEEELQARQAAKAPSGVENFVAPATVTIVDVAVEATALPGSDPEAVKAAVEARLGEYLSLAKWGTPREGDASNSAGWENATTVYRNELIAEVDRLPGLGRVVDLTLAKGGGELGSADVELDEPAPLAELGGLSVVIA